MCLYSGVLVVVHLCITSVSYNNLPEFGLMSFLSNKYHRVWCILVVGTQWVGHSCVTSVHFGLMHAWDYGCSVLRNGIPGSLGTTLDLGCDNYLPSYNVRDWLKCKCKGRGQPIAWWVAWLTPTTGHDGP